ncbi:phospholipase D-like domain-containing protein [Paraburkholderia phytofirmans]|nr:phosphatidylserine/phosphatidylglycerophosphate/cardiolipin synthase-like protein [Paraburkholderia phytofirmans]
MTTQYNYTRSAKERNSENAAVFWNNPEIATAYEGHFQSRLSYCQWYHG